MTENACGRFRERIPELAAGRLDDGELREVRVHAEGCAECASDLRVAELLFQARSRPPAGLADRIKAELSLQDVGGPSPARVRDRSGLLFPWWGLAAAAVAAVALGIGVDVQTPGTAGAPVPAYAQEGEEGELWLSGDGEIAGAPTLDDVSDEALLRFLEELDEGGVG